MSNPNRKWKTLTQHAEYAEEHHCRRCDGEWRLKLGSMTTLEEAQKRVCKCEEYCGWEFCGQPGPPHPAYEEIPRADDWADLSAEYGFGYFGYEESED